MFGPTARKATTSSKFTASVFVVLQFGFWTLERMCLKSWRKGNKSATYTTSRSLKKHAALANLAWNPPSPKRERILRASTKSRADLQHIAAAVIETKCAFPLCGDSAHIINQKNQHGITDTILIMNNGADLPLETYLDQENHRFPHIQLAYAPVELRDLRNLYGPFSAVSTPILRCLIWNWLWRSTNWIQFWISPSSKFQQKNYNFSVFI